MPNVMRDAPIEEVRNEAMTVRCHRDEVDILLTGNANDLVGRFAVREYIVGLNSFFLQAFAKIRQVIAILSHFLRFSKLELIEIACYPTVSDTDQKELCARECDEVLDVVQDYLIVGGVLDRNQNSLVHGLLWGPAEKPGQLTVRSSFLTRFGVGSCALER